MSLLLHIETFWPTVRNLHVRIKLWLASHIDGAAYAKPTYEYVVGMKSSLFVTFSWVIYSLRERYICNAKYPPYDSVHRMLNKTNINMIDIVVLDCFGTGHFSSPYQTLFVRFTYWNNLKQLFIKKKLLPIT